jgi:hypothetical protein
MGKLSLKNDQDMGTSSTVLYLSLTNPAAEQSLFQELNTKPTILRIDIYFSCLVPVLLSPRLTVLEFVLGGDLKYQADPIDWPLVLSFTPNLVELSLWDGQQAYDPLLKHSKDHNPIQLLRLRSLSLSGRFTLLCELLAETPLPVLQYLSLDTIDSAEIIPLYLSRIALVSPQLSHVAIGSQSYVANGDHCSWWEKAFQTLLPSLRELSFVEMEWRAIAVALDELAKLPHRLSRVRLGRIWDLEPYDWSLLQSSEAGMPAIENIDGVYGGLAQCGGHTDVEHSCTSEVGSNCK